jgi:hypothetical protein
MLSLGSGSDPRRAHWLIALLQTKASRNCFESEAFFENYFAETRIQFGPGYNKADRMLAKGMSFFSL